MVKCRRIKQIRTQKVIRRRIVTAKIQNTDRVLQQPAAEAVVNALGRGVVFKFPDKFLILHKVILYRLFKVWIADHIHKVEQVFIHFLHVPVARRHVVSQNIFVLVGFSELLDIEL